MSSIVIPRLAGSRERAVDLTSVLPDDLSGSAVTIDAAGVDAAAQSFADELCKQILETRHASSLEVHRASPRFAQYLNSSAARRGVSERLLVDIRA